MKTLRTSWTSVLATVAVVGMLALVVAGVAWHSQGGRWFVTTSPSMGQELPVGTLLLTSRTTVAETEVGDVVTFSSPGSGTVFTHRVVAKDDAGLQTQGDVNGVPDAWVITDRELVGDVAWHAPALGYVAKGLPLLLIGLVLVRLATRRLADVPRHSMRLLGTSMVVAFVSWWLNPWVGMARLGQAAAPEGQKGVLMDVISTGLLPIQAREVGGSASVRLVDGQTGELHLTAGAKTGAYDVAAALHLPWWGWVVLSVICFIPLWWSLALRATTSVTLPTHALVGAGR